MTDCIRDAVCLVGDPLDRWEETAARYAASGLFSRIGLPDSQSIYPDVHIRCALLARLGGEVQFGPFVINPATRTPALAVAEITELTRLAPGSVFLGIGRGDSALATVGQRPATTRQFEDYVQAVRNLLAGRAARWQGQLLQPLAHAVPVPLYVAAVGPRSLRLAGRVGDGVIIGAGIDPDTISACSRLVAEGAREAGRDPADLDVWWYALAGVAEDASEADRELRHSLASFANAAFKGGTNGKAVPECFLPAVARLTSGYNPMAHARAGNRQHSGLVADPGFRAYLLHRFALCGTPEQVARQRARAAAAGATQLWLSVRAPDKYRFLRLWGASKAYRMIAPLLVGVPVPVFSASHYKLAYQRDDFADPWRPHAVVFLLPGYCRTMDFWRSWVPALAQTLTVIRLELPGCGSSPEVPADVELSFDHITGDIHEMIGALAPGGAHLIGESSGGLLAALLADRHPGSVRSLTMVSTPIGIGQRTTGPHSLGYSSWDEALRQLGMREWWLRSRREVVGVPLNPPRDDHWAGQFARTPVETALRYRRAVVGRTVGDLLGTLSVPTLVMRPEASPFMGEDDLAAWQAIPHGEVRTYPLSNDMYYLSPAPLVADCVAFLSGVDVAARLVNWAE